MFIQNWIEKNRKRRGRSIYHQMRETFTWGDSEEKLSQL